ncbi:MAG: hypothetical protein KIT14_19765 [bacterium]|nr:hypothetical protein [bacterium]
MRVLRLAVLPVAVLVHGGLALADADRECAVSLQTRPAATRNRVVQTACEGRCRFDVVVCRAVNGCAAPPASAVRVRLQPPADGLAVPETDGRCGGSTSVVLRPGERRRIRVTSVDRDGRPLDRDRLVLVCRPESAPCPGTTTTTTTLPVGGCVVTGCSGEICAKEPLMSVCWWFPAFVCFSSATCAPQADGQCGWIIDEALRTCLGRYGGAVPPGS